MRRDEFTVQRQDAVSLNVALRAYLDQCSREELLGAHPDSCIAKVRRMHNRCLNLMHGVDAEYRLERNWWE